MRSISFLSDISLSFKGVEYAGVCIVPDAAVETTGSRIKICVRLIGGSQTSEGSIVVWGTRGLGVTF